MSGSMTPPREKLAWANHHIATLDNEIQRFFDGDDYTVGSNFDEETEQHVIAVRIKNEPPLLRWSHITGDALHSLRATLDYLIYQLAIRGTGKEPPPNHRDLQFPIFINEHGDRGYDSKAPKQIAGIPPGAETLVKGVHPFGDRNHPLFLLNKLNNADKHRTPHLTVAFLRSVHAYDANSVGVLSAGGGAGYVHLDTGHKVVHALYDGMELMRSRFGPPEVNRAADVKVDAPFDVLFDEGTPGVPHEVVASTLQTFSECVRDILDAFEPFLS